MDKSLIRVFDGMLGSKQGKQTLLDTAREPGRQGELVREYFRVVHRLTYSVARGIDVTTGLPTTVEAPPLAVDPLPVAPRSRTWTLPEIAREEREQTARSAKRAKQAERSARVSVNADGQTWKVTPELAQLLRQHGITE